MKVELISVANRSACNDDDLPCLKPYCASMSVLLLLRYVVSF